MTKQWTAIAREAGLAAEHMASGVTALGRANYAQQAYYAQAFFALSIGLERSAKLALALDHFLRNRGTFPDNKGLRSYGHDLVPLLYKMDQIAVSLNLPTPETRLPDSAIHSAIIEVLSDFSKNITRYYNLDLITGAPSADPIGQWFSRVVKPICDLHYSPKQRERRERNASIIDSLLSGVTFVSYQREDGASIDSVYEASARTGITEQVAPYVRLYVAQIVRFVGCVLSDLGYKLHGHDIPNLAEFFAIFNNSDRYLKGRKVWSIYKP